MNIFFLHRDPKICAEQHCDKHVTKMTLETAQLLSTAHHKLSSSPHPNLYRINHVNHPTSIWVRQTVDQYNWTYELFYCLSQEYTRRYSKIHKSWTRMHKILQDPPDTLLKTGWTDPPQCMPDYCKMDDTINAYKNYYIKEKHHFAKWRYTETPKWFLNIS